MLDNQTQDKLTQLKLSGFTEVFQEVTQQSTANQTWQEVIGLMADRELLHRDNRRQSRLLKIAKLKCPQATLEAVDYQASRKFNQQLYRQCASGQWQNQAQNLIFIGPTGVGKTFLACALGYQLCKLGKSVRYYRLTRLLEQLRLALADGSYTKQLMMLCKTQCLILDDFGIDQLDREARKNLLEVIDDRSGVSSTIITTQLPIELWADFIGDQTLADAICDRLLNQSLQFIIEGESMRSKKNS